MKQIINGKLYDTDTATCLGSYCYGNYGDFHHVSEELYQKKNGEFFLAGEGGPLSEYAVQTDTNSWSGGEQIIPYSENEARCWAEEHMSADEYIDVFGDVEE